MADDLRNDKAKARDAFFESEEGQKVLSPEILWSPHHSKYLKNRIEVAFLAGWDAREAQASADGRQ